MGQKVHPLALRLGIIKSWRSYWFVPRNEYGKYIYEDYNIRKFIKKRLKIAAVSKIVIERLSERIKVRIFTARPGMIIGRHGSEIERLREDLNSLVSKEISIDIQEIKQPTMDAQLVSENVAFQLEKRIAFRRAIKRAIEQSMSSGAEGIKISISGRLGGAEMSRRETYKEGKVPLQTLRADIDYGFTEALTAYGLIGVKVWIYKGLVFIKRAKDSQQNLENKNQEASQ
ncbi:MAG: 30S ribosomal protein S3 [Candidatus Omnitrophica bacterium]|nr:30S ribosomal protein S3 [Candidatus Omnitrophota bacterium]MBU1871926.1 30S ribosomal protein S3 [Candidatus Omnitrophota bacterium]